MTRTIRLARAADAPQLAAIYAPHVDASVASFEERAPTAGEMAARVAAVLARYPWLVEENADGAVAGYAYATLHRERAAYRWTVETSVYVAAAAQQQGVGTRLYGVLFDVLTAQGFTEALAGIALPNPASVALHQRLGFEEVARYPRIGHKLGRWVDVVWLQRRLATPSGAPPPPILLPEALLDETVRRRLG